MKFLNLTASNSIDKSIDKFIASEHISDKFYFLQPRWSEYLDGPKTLVGLFQDKNYFIFAFFIQAEYLRLEETEINSQVCNDSCLEIFIQLKDKNYLNLEVNGLGIIHLAKGLNRESRYLQSVDWIKENIEFTTSLEGDPSPIAAYPVNWKAILKIKKTGLFQFINKSLGKMKLNIYKCGDLSKIPHYLTLFPIETDSPDFHRPEYFQWVRI